jgi:hypothetical protein
MVKHVSERQIHTAKTVHTLQLFTLSGCLILSGSIGAEANVFSVKLTDAMK